MPESSWRLEGQYTIKATVYPKGSSEPRESVLNFDRLCRLTSSFTETNYLTYIAAPDDLGHPNSEHLPHKELSKEVDVAISDRGNGILHSRCVIKGGLRDSVFDTDFDMKPYIRYSDDGHIEFIHPRDADNTPGWAKVLFNALASYEKSAKLVGGMGPVGNELEKRLNELVDQFEQWVLPKAADPNIKEWLRGTYVDGEGRLIRRGT